MKVVAGMRVQGLEGEVLPCYVERGGEHGPGVEVTRRVYGDIPVQR
jgi:hypothetical protein